MDLPRLTLMPNLKTQAVAGRPWIFAGQISPDTIWKSLNMGSIAQIADAQGRILGLYHVNPHSLIAARLLTRNTTRAIDTQFFKQRIERAVALRAALGLGVHHRLVHGEADGLPGLIIDRYDDTLVLQPNTAGMMHALDFIIPALKSTLPIKNILLNAGGPARQQEGLEDSQEVLQGCAPSPCIVMENGFVYHCTLTDGQKTGWFFDHRPNRALVAGLAANKSVLDLYSYAGGFGLLAAKAGARAVLSVDRARAALDQAQQAAQQAHLTNWQSEQAEAFDWLEASDKARFDIVVADPPAFAKSKKDIPTALKGYRKLARLGAERVLPSGFLLLASCSHHVDPAHFLDECTQGIRSSGRSCVLIAQGGAGPDHPIHPLLPQSGYLKALLFALD
jgi:23S rRNA (cytosine1962-C5)-methyltransferase